MSLSQFMKRFSGLLLTICFSILYAGVAPAMADDNIIVAIGASSTAGRGVSSAEAYPAQLETMLKAKGRDVKVINAGINGDTSAGMLSRIDRDVPDGTGIVILQRGTNDADELNHEKNLADIIDRLRRRGIKIVFLETATLAHLRKNFAQADGHHLTAEGNRALASRLLPKVLQTLDRR